LRVLLGRRKHVVLKCANSKTDVNGAAVFYSHNGYTGMRKQYENELNSAEDDHTGLCLALISVESIVEGFIGEEEAYYIEMLK